MGSESSYLLRQLIIAKYFESLHWKVEFLCCTGFTNACNKERIGKSQEDTPFMCSECSWGYSYIQEKTKVPINYLEKKKLDPDEIDIDQVTQVLKNNLGKQFVPKEFLVVKQIPEIGIGKPDRVKASQLFLDKQR
jgi:serine protease inhibitor ecotin